MLPLTHPQGRSVTCLCASRARVGPFLCTCKGWGVAFSNASRGGKGESRFYAPACQGGSRFLAPAGQGCDFFMHQQTYMQPFYAPAGLGVTLLCTRAGVSPFHAPAGDTFLCTSIVGMDQLGRYVTSPCASMAGVLFFMHQQAGDVTS